VTLAESKPPPWAPLTARFAAIFWKDLISDVGYARRPRSLGAERHIQTGHRGNRFGALRGSLRRSFVRAFGFVRTKRRRPLTDRVTVTTVTSVTESKRRVMSAPFKPAIAAIVL
jgi:hypothetical protein